MKKSLNIGIIQASSIFGNIDSNLQKAVFLIKKAKIKGAQIVCLPELYINGYDMDRYTLYSSESIEDNKEKIEQTISKLAAVNDIYIILPYATYESGKTLNSAMLFDNKGLIVGKYDKTHLFEAERRVFDKGNDIVVWDTDIGKIGIMICYDAGFPEVARVLKLKGADIIFCPSAWRIQDKEIWDINLKQRAIENRVYVIGINSVTKTEKLHLFGGSKAVSPDGRVIANVGIDNEDVLVCEIDFESVESYKMKEDYMMDRRPELYSVITTQLIERNL